MALVQQLLQLAYTRLWGADDEAHLGWTRQRMPRQESKGDLPNSQIATQRVARIRTCIGEWAFRSGPRPHAAHADPAGTGPRLSANCGI